jgi:predicted MPP superfamily phosphohydrolase
VRARFITFIIIIQSILLATHGFLYATLVFFWQPDTPSLPWLRAAFLLLGFSFVAASVLAFRFYNLAVRLFYTAAAVWLGFGSFLLWAGCGLWVSYFALRITGAGAARKHMLLGWIAVAVVAGVYGILNATRIGVRTITVKLLGLPDSWKGRTAVLVTDTHLGPVNGHRFSKRIATMVTELQPSAVFMSGDFYDGTAADLEGFAEPWRHVSTPLGAYFVTGNHEEFSDRTKYLNALSAAGIRVLNNEKIELDGLQLVGVHDRESGNPERFRAILDRAALDRTRASILLVHAPHRLEIPEEAGIRLQLSGHTHGGQFFPYTWITSRIYGKFVYGLQQFGSMQVYTSYGAGTWGPPLRVGTRPEIVLIRFASE